MRVRRTVIVVAVLLASLIFSGCQSQAPEAEPLQDPVGEGISHEAEQAPPLKLSTVEGKAINLEDYKGQYVYLNFWNTACRYCIDELDELQVFAEAHDSELTVLTVHVGDDADLKQVLKDQAFKLPVMLDLDGSVAESFMVEAYPSTYLIDKEGRINGFIPEALTMEALEGSFEFLKRQESQQK